MLNLVSWLCEVVTSGRTLVGFKIYSRHRINPELRQVNRLVKPPLNSNIFSSGSLKKQVCPGERSNKFTRRLKRRQKKKTKKNNAASVRSGSTIYRSVIRRVECDGDSDIKSLSDLKNYQQRQRRGLKINSEREAGAPHTSQLSGHLM